MFYDTAAILTIKHANSFTKKGRKDLASWLHRQAREFLEDGEQYSPKFTARYKVDCPMERPKTKHRKVKEYRDV